VFCEGEAPRGACCDATPAVIGLGEATCMTVPEQGCLGNNKRWSVGNACPGKCFVTNEPCAIDDDCRTCSFSNTACFDDEDCPPGEVCENDDFCGVSDPFNPPCGTYACCAPPESPLGEGCFNLTKAECQSYLDADGHQAIWQPNQFCEVANQSCGWWACRFANEGCADSPHDVGCDEDACCQDVCGIDNWCCESEWDHVCQREACSLCELGCAPEIGSPGDPSDDFVTNVQAPIGRAPGARQEDLTVEVSGSDPDGGPTEWTRSVFTSVQVSLDENGHNLWGDANHQPSIAVDPTNSDRIVVGWQQFADKTNTFREAGWAYSEDGGLTWHRESPGVLDQGEFRAHPVVVADEAGTFYYSAATTTAITGNVEPCSVLYKSNDGGVTWNEGIDVAVGRHSWMTVDRTTSDGLLYIRGYCEVGELLRSADDGDSISDATLLEVGLGTMTVGPDGTLYVVGTNYPEDFYKVAVARSSNAQVMNEEPEFDLVPDVGLVAIQENDPNPGNIIARTWIGTDHSDGPYSGNVYVIGTLGENDLGFVRSEDGGQTWSEPVRINNDVDVPGDNWQWFGTMSVAPDTRNSGADNLSELFYAYSVDAGETWRGNVPVSPMFDSHIGAPPTNGIGFHYHMLSDNEGANVAYAATFNGEQDVYFLRINTIDCNENGVLDQQELDMGSVDDCNENLFPDVCEPDFDGDDVIDVCDDDIDGDGVLNGFDKCAMTPVGTPVGPFGRPRGDTTGNCVLDLIDYERLRTCLVLSGTDAPVPATLCAAPVDYDDDGDIDLADAAAFARMFDAPVD